MAHPDALVERTADPGEPLPPLPDCAYPPGAVTLPAAPDPLEALRTALTLAASDDPDVARTARIAVAGHAVRLAATVGPDRVLRDLPRDGAARPVRRLMRALLPAARLQQDTTREEPRG
mgnify:CR=1 FL=1